MHKLSVGELSANPTSMDLNNMTAALIGITTAHMPHPEGLPMVAVQESYVRSVLNAGGVPLLIPLGLQFSDLQVILERVDGILLTGGGDLDPQRFGGEAHPTIHQVDPDRDEVEIHLVDESVRLRKPFLGICRGIQVINVAFGGSLYTDISSQRPNSLAHEWVPGRPWSHLTHSIRVEEGSRLAQILGGTHFEVNSLHHQAISRLEHSFQATAYASDGVIEAIELPEHPFGIAVQWHPEWLQDHPPMRALFSAFVQAAGENAVAKKGDQQPVG
jgi:putative glutamine amidotransferase